MAKKRSIEKTFHTLEEYLTYWGLPKSSLDPVCKEIRRHIDNEGFEQYLKGLERGCEYALEERERELKQQGL